MYVIAAVIAFVFALVAAQCVITIRRNKKNVEECTAEVYASVTGRTERPAMSRSRGAYTRTVWTLEYVYGGVKYVESSQDVPFHTDVGSTLVIHLDRDNPKRFYVEGAAKRSYVYVALILIGKMFAYLMPKAVKP